MRTKENSLPPYSRPPPNLDSVRHRTSPGPCEAVPDLPSAGRTDGVCFGGGRVVRRKGCPPVGLLTRPPSDVPSACRDDRPSAFGCPVCLSRRPPEPPDRPPHPPSACGAVRLSFASAHCSDRRSACPPVRPSLRPRLPPRPPYSRPSAQLSDRPAVRSRIQCGLQCTELAVLFQNSATKYSLLIL